jgi:hypothetical protein
MTLTSPNYEADTVHIIGGSQPFVLLFICPADAKRPIYLNLHEDVDPHGSSVLIATAGWKSPSIRE